MPRPRRSPSVPLLPLALALVAALAPLGAAQPAQGEVFVRWTAAIEQEDREGVESTRVVFDPATRRLTSLLVVNREEATISNVTLRVEPRGLPVNVTLGGVQPEGDRPQAEVQRWEIVLPNASVAVGMELRIPNAPGAEFELEATVAYTVGGEDGERRETVTRLPGRVSGEPARGVPGPDALAPLAALGATAALARRAPAGRP